ncbi:HNH endonuclease, partial [Enterobacter hormaechei]|nr:HNH endonuclease [Enterobacter hormaechei]
GGVPGGVMGGGLVGGVFWDFAGKQIALPMVKGNYPKEGYVEWHRREVFRG